MMKHPGKKIKCIGPSMLPALSLNALAGIMPGTGVNKKQFNGGCPCHQPDTPVFYLLMSENSASVCNPRS
jgi:hypothetical protein